MGQRPSEVVPNTSGGPISEEQERGVEVDVAFHSQEWVVAREQLANVTKQFLVDRVAAKEPEDTP